MNIDKSVNIYTSLGLVVVSQNNPHGEPDTIVLDGSSALLVAQAIWDQAMALPPSPVLEARGSLVPSGLDADGREVES